MIAPLRLLAVAATAAVTLPAHASPVVLDFENLYSASAGPFVLDGAYFKADGGITPNASEAVIRITGNAVVTQAGEPPSNNVPAPTTGGSGFIYNRDGRVLTITAQNGFLFNELSFDYAISSGSHVDLFGAFDVPTATDFVDEVFPSGAGYVWNDAAHPYSTGDQSGSGNFSSFSVTSSSTNGKFGIDNLTLTYNCPTTTSCGGGTVPEPASFGIVAIALLGAGLASRRRSLLAPV